jgi:carbon-monoxide dehydrogenase iron sulfur subunit
MRTAIRPEYCMNCHLCMVACVTAHAHNDDPVRAYRETPRPEERVRVAERRPASLPINCRHCDQPFCVLSCISGAMTKDPATGIVYCREDKCVGCLTCMAVCPMGAIWPSAHKPGVAKCDLCRERGKPACVEACPNGVLTLEGNA